MDKQPLGPTGRLSPGFAHPPRPSPRSLTGGLGHGAIATAAAAIALIGDFLWEDAGGVPFRFAVTPYIDAAVVGYLALCFSFLQRRKVLTTLLLGVFLAAVFLGFSITLSVFGERLRLSHISLVGLAADFYDLRVVIWIAAIAIAGVFLFNLRLPGGRAFLVMLPLLAFAGIAMGKAWVPHLTAKVVPRAVIGEHELDSSATVGHALGFFLDALIRLDRRADYRRLVEKNAGAPVEDFITAEAPEAAANAPRTILMILVESLIDPARLSQVSYSDDPVAPDLRRWISEGGSRVLAPVFGQRSADSELELLCGIPATLDVNQVVMADLAAETLDCLPRKLTRMGWRTFADQPLPPHFFNTRNAYKAFGFEWIRMADKFDMTDVDEGLFASADGGIGKQTTLSAKATLDQTFDRLRPLIEGGDRVFSYVFLNAGHYPFELNTQIRPLVVEPSPATERLTKYVNHVYYNTHAVQDYVRRVLALDPDAMVVITGDHPPLIKEVRDASPAPHRRLEVPFIFVRGGRVLPLTRRTLPSYLVPEILLDRLSGGAFCEARDCLKDRPFAYRTDFDGVYVIDRRGDLVTECRGGGDIPPPCAAAIRLQERSKLRLLGLIGVQ